MAIVTLEMVKEQLFFTDDIGETDDNLLTRKIAAAQSHIERQLGYKIEEEYPPAGDPPVSTVPPALIEGVCQLAAFWYEHRGSGVLDAGEAFKELPHDIREIVREFRNWSF